MAYNKSADGSSMKRRPMRRRKKVCVFCGKTMSLITKIQTN